jgi:hypothetical protein
MSAQRPTPTAYRGECCLAKTAMHNLKIAVGWAWAGQVDETLDCFALRISKKDTVRTPAAGGEFSLLLSFLKGDSACPELYALLP